MSLGISVGDGAMEWSGDSLGAVFAQRRNLVSPRFLLMLRSIFRFNKCALIDLERGALEGLSLGDYLKAKRFPTGFIEDYLVPMGAAIWSTPDADIMDFPASSFVRFFANHRLLEVRPPEWRTVSGGSRTYVKKLVEPLGDKVLLGRQVTEVRRRGETVEVTDSSGETRSFDYAIMAAHSDQSLEMLKMPRTRKARFWPMCGTGPTMSICIATRR
jgi:predicted NAD/FAD-binding protein